MTQWDAIVVGAGMVGVCTAIELRKRGLDVALVDRREPGRETSFGNAGVIQREGIHPYLFPRDWRVLLNAALGRSAEARYQLTSLPAVAPFLWRYWRASGPEAARRTYEANIPLFADCLTTHGMLAEEAGASALIRKSGWLKVSRDPASIQAHEAELSDLRGLGLSVDVVDTTELAELEPHLEGKSLAGAVYYRDPWSCSDPGGLVEAYAALYRKLGGRVIRADVTGMQRQASHWQVETGSETLKADTVVLAAGPWSKTMLDALGLRLPMGIKRGYHCHYDLAGNATLNRPVLDEDNGYVMAPMAQGLRITTGAEFARIDAPANPVQLAMAEPHASGLLPLGSRRDETPWLGARPVFPDLLPVMGEAPGFPGLLLNFGHGHQGFTLGPVAGRHVAQLVTGEVPSIAPEPYQAERFLS